MRYEIVSPENVRQCWGFVKPGLEKILCKSPEPWIPEDVYASCVGGKAGLWLANKDDVCVGFVVCYANNGDFHVWCAYGFLDGQISQWFALLRDIAKSGGASRITFDSWRPAWNKVAKELGFKPRSWAMEI